VTTSSCPIDHGQPGSCPAAVQFLSWCRRNPARGKVFFSSNVSCKGRESGPPNRTRKCNSYGYTSAPDHARARLLLQYGEYGVGVTATPLSHRSSLAHSRRNAFKILQPLSSNMHQHFYQSNQRYMHISLSARQCLAYAVN